ncbi:MAG: 2-hydroxychromene-2-carboxylate isomerase [Rhodospirillales bacterium]|nr:2-hydroxychromene-2-carboxylate isomerase [Rhodospirillales bacterium]MBO6786538.1 2-hydroxychromene-2-carboxylate isomerase [Rhodospirillales bacterium]
MPTVDYYFTLVSPWTYLGDAKFKEICDKHGATIRHLPVNLGRVFEATGGLPLAKRSDARKALRMQELKRWREYRNVVLNLEPAHFPVSDKLAAGMVIAAQETGNDVYEFCHAIMRAVWAEERDISDTDTMIEIANACGLDGKLLSTAALSPSVEQKWEADTDMAIQRGVMGAPFYIIGEETLWGQDRLDFVDRILAKAKD